jgi:putative nucleotidyltransferase with HDIG domain
MQTTHPQSNGNGHTNGNGNGHAKSVLVSKASDKPAPGSRLAAAFESVERFPVLIESRERVMQAATLEPARVSDLVETVESDVALTIAVLRLANHSSSAPAGVASIPEAVDMLKPSGVLAIAGTAAVFDFFKPNGSRDLRPERFRMHALATQYAADRIGRIIGWDERDELAIAALLHDIGRLVIADLHPGQRGYGDFSSHAPEQRIREEREQLGIDHALVGGVLARRWNIPQRIAVAIERHHADDAEGLAAIVGAADMIAHYAQGEAVSPDRMRSAGERCGLDTEELRSLLYELPYPNQEGPRVSEPCPLSKRELDVLRLLADGMVYKEIAGEKQI